MLRRLHRAVVLLPGMCLSAVWAQPDAKGQAAPASSAPTLRVMSYNIRTGNANDGPNRWDLRKDLCVSRTTTFDADLVGLQEAIVYQRDFFHDKLEGFGVLGTAVKDGKRNGEFTSILYRKSRLELVDSGTFWLSKTPEDPGSRGWDAKLPRNATWGIFKDRKVDGREFLYLNTHFDHVGDEARRESAKMVRAFLEEHAKGPSAGSGQSRPVIVTGDFNAHPDSPPYRLIVKGGEGDKPLVDTFLALHPEPAEGTAHGFSGKGHARIDWILCSSSFEVREAEIDRHHEGNLYPSDHFPITAVVAWPAR